ncbi:aminodeoxychorismate synthase component I [Schaalia suimastitidis]|uniref:aminodeoxychorismate synthase component I n=1 Tax=Schaalia suimastitidis TaxID=121163 RepID=UPI0004065368|nr:aminodeoxychorismate synthase component I [Schaalia suimastitidis]
MLPDAYVTFVERAVVFDHVSGDCILMALHSGGDDPDLDQATIQWCNETEQKIAALASAPPAPSKPLPYPPHEQVEQVFTFRHNRQAYLGLIDHCKELIAAGQTYEVCLTNMVTYPHSLDPLETYRRLRTQARVPFGALLRCGTYSVLSASPERFLSVDTDGHVAATPIKGTRPRSHNPQEDEDLRRDLKESEKDRAENLMIVDLLRNDLSIVCEPGSVQVPCLFDVESYPSVHQLVSTVTGRLRSDASTIDCVRAAFPGGSMTGAPKIRTLEIIDTLEGGPRGIYSGAIGWFSPNGAADLSIVIRTLVVERTQATFGVGGAITHLSVPECEWEETLVKARTIASSILQ